MDARIAPPFMEATDASRLVCVVVVSYQEYSLTHSLTWPHICIYTTSVWAAQAKPRSSQLATVWPLAVVSHSWCTSSQQDRLTTIVRRREKSSILEILHAFTPQSVEFLFSTGDPTPGGPIVPCAFLQTNALRGSTIAKMLMGHRCDSLGDA